MKQKIEVTLKIINYILCIVPLLVVVMWLPFFPETIPAHYNGNGVDRYGSKFELLLFPLTNFVCFFILPLISSLNNIKNGEEFQKNSIKIKISSAILYLVVDILAIYFTIKAYNLSNHVVGDFYQIALLVVSLLYFVLGTITMFSQPNKIIGIRTVETLSNKELWRKLNLISGTIITILSLGLIALNLLYVNTYINIIVLLVANVFNSILPIVVPKIYAKFSKNKFNENET